MARGKLQNTGRGCTHCGYPIRKDNRSGYCQTCIHASILPAVCVTCGADFKIGIYALKAIEIEGRKLRCKACIQSTPHKTEEEKMTARVVVTCACGATSTMMRGMAKSNERMGRTWRCPLCAKKRKRQLAKDRAAAEAKVISVRANGCILSPSSIKVEIRGALNDRPFRAARCKDYSLCKRGLYSDFFNVGSCLDDFAGQFQEGWTAEGEADLMSAEDMQMIAMEIMGDRPSCQGLAVENHAVNAC